ncbi:MAG: VWA domain-containing protein [Alistipes sp.]|jgi:Ca-activated chloride channel family protein|nr:VWA domain-containing protein [Alistipes sp.]
MKTLQSTLAALALGTLVVLAAACASRAGKSTGDRQTIVGDVATGPTPEPAGLPQTIPVEPAPGPPMVQEEMVVDAQLSRMASAFAPGYDALDAEEYAHTGENRFVNVSRDPLSTFALEVDGASYANVRRLLNRGRMPAPDAVRVEEFVNYFSYDYPRPTGRDPLRVNYEVGACPWNPAHRLVSIGVAAREIPSDGLPAANFVFLIDVSGSMYGRLPLVVASMKLLVNNLRPEDRVAIVTYAGSDRLALPPTPGSDRQKIREVLDGLASGGSTAGAAGLTTAYNVARQNFIEGGNNRIILATDGDFNVGQSSDEAMEALIERERRGGVFLTVLGYGMGNLKDKKMQILAEKGNGNHAYIDNIQEANRVLVGEFGGTMYAVAKDVKLQVEFNPARVSAFRLVGYESRLLAHEDFNDDTKDAGEIGAGHTVTALYEIVPADSGSGAGSIDPLKYPRPAATPAYTSDIHTRELATVKIRYKQPDGDVSSRIEMPIVDRAAAPSDEFRFASAAAMFAQLLRGSDFSGEATYAIVAGEARRGLGNDPNGYRRELVRLAEVAAGLDASTGR